MSISNSVVNREQRNHDSDSINDVKQYFIQEEKYQLLKQCQQAIFVATEVSPSIRKMVNEIINYENLEKVKTKFINNFKQ